MRYIWRTRCLINPFYIEKNGVKIGGSKRIKEVYLEKTGISDGKEWYKYHSNYDIWKTGRTNVKSTIALILHELGKIDDYLKEVTVFLNPVTWSN